MGGFVAETPEEESTALLSTKGLFVRDGGAPNPEQKMAECKLALRQKF